MTATAWWGLSVYTGARPFPPAPALPYGWSPMLSASAFLLGSHSYFLGGSRLSLGGSSSRFCLLPWRRLPLKGHGSPPLQHAGRLSSPGMWAIGSPRLFSRSFWGAWREEALYAVQGPAWTAFTVFSSPRSSWISMVESSTPFAYALPVSLLMWSSGSVG
jgi:hypothetical protein